MDSGPNRSVHTAGYVSFDNGATWSEALYAGEYFADDPTVGYDPDGTAYLIHKSDTGVNTSDGMWTSDFDRLAIHRSRDGGHTWEHIRGPQANDRPFLGIDPQSGALYVAQEQHYHGEEPGHANDNFRHAVRLLCSRDGGNHFEVPAQRLLMDVTATTANNCVVGGVVLLPNGVVGIVQHHWRSQGTNAGGKSREIAGWLNFFRSTDAGASLRPAIKIADIQSPYNDPKSRGVTSAVAAFGNRVNAVWADVRSGRSQIYEAHSVDGGMTWSAPQVVSDDSARASGGPDDFMPTIAVNRDGVVGVLWYDRRENEDNHGYYPRFAASTDGGRTWSPSVRISEKPNSVPASHGQFDFAVTGGDTAGLTATPDGHFHAAWIDNRTGVQQVWTAIIIVH